MRVSVIMPVYNRSDFVRLCLLSLNEQSHRPAEVVISDDGSDEDVLGAVQGMAGGLGFSITYVRQEHRGFRLAKSRNNGIRHSTGSYLIFNDQDIVHTRDYILTFVRHHRRREFLVAYPVRLTSQQMLQLNDDLIGAGNWAGGWITRDQVGKVRRQFGKDWLEYALMRVAGKTRYRLKLRGGVFGIHREDLLEVDGFDENYQDWGYEDDDLGRRLYRAGILGRNVFRDQFPVHLYHLPYHEQGIRTNRHYYQRRIQQIRDGDYRAVRGLSQTEHEEGLMVLHVQ